LGWDANPNLGAREAVEVGDGTVRRSVGEFLGLPITDSPFPTTPYVLDQFAGSVTIVRRGWVLIDSVCVYVVTGDQIDWRSVLV